MSIAQATHGNLHFKAGRIGICCPLYGHEMQALVKAFIQKATFDTDCLYLLETYGHRHGGANKLAKDVFEDGFIIDAETTNSEVRRQFDSFLDS